MVMVRELEVDIQDAIQSLDLEEGWMEKVLALDEDSLASLLGELANRGHITNKKARSKLELESFKCQWEEFASHFGLPIRLRGVEPPLFTTSVY
jgi:hypothetical protein